MTSTLPLPQWQENRKRKKIITSASQYETFERCKRLWWLERVRRLPTPPTKAQVFGTVLHAVAERYLLADDTGRDPETGEVVDLYPEGWHIARDRFSDRIDGELEPGAQDLIKRLIDKAIEEGILARGKDRAVERQFREIVLETEETGTEVEIMGFIDLEFFGEIVDHKTTISMKYAKSPAKLAKNTQALVYAAMHLRALRAQGAAMPETITIRHNYFCKDALKPEVRKVEATVPVSEVLEKWEEIEKHTREMVELRNTVEDGFTEIPDPDDPYTSCNMYGGCHFRSICGGRESVDSYLKRLDKMKDRQKNGVTPRGAQREAIVATNKKDEEMPVDFKTALAAKRAARAGNTTPATKPPKIETAETPPAAPPTPGGDADAAPPPWAKADCMACNGTGFDSGGNICRICSHKVIKAGGTMNYSLEPLGDGLVAWVNNDAGESGISPLASAGTPVAATERKTTPTPPPAAEKPEEPDEDDEDDEDEKPSKSNGKVGRPKKGFVLCINCAPTRPTPGQRQGSGRYVHHLVEILEELKPQLAEAQGVDSFFDIDFFTRRDLFAKNAEEISALFRTDIVVVENLANSPSDIKHLCEAIRPYAGMVIHGHA